MVFRLPEIRDGFATWLFRCSSCKVVTASSEMQPPFVMDRLSYSLVPLTQPLQHPMYLSKLVCSLLVTGLLLAACDLSSETEPDSLEFTTEPSDELSAMIDETPSDFTWAFFNDNVTVSMIPGSNWSGDLVLSAFQLQDGEVVHRTTTDPVSTTAEALSSGRSTEDLIPGSSWVPGPQWAPASNWIPGSSWIPGSNWSPSEIEDQAREAFDLAEGETVVVVYAHTPDDSQTQTTQPFGILMQREEATETAGSAPAPTR